MSGLGTVYTYTIIRQVVANSEFFEDKVPFAVGVIQLQEGPRMISNIIGCGLDKITIGMPVAVVFDDVNQEMALPKFEPNSERFS